MVRLILLVLLVADCWTQEEVELEPLPDYYATLNVSPKASVREIKKSFRKLAQFYHPDKNKDETAQDIFQELSEAYSVLSDKEKKTEYDQLFFYEFEDFSNEVKTEYEEEDFTVEEPEEPEEDLNTLPEENYETEEEEYIPETESDFKASEPGSTSDSKGKDDIWEDIDDEALFKVLKFLADHDYEITKKTVYKEAEDTQYRESEGGRDFDTRRQRRAAEPTYRREHGSGQHYTSHTQAGHDRTYTPAPPTFKRHHDHKPEYRRTNDYGSYSYDHKSYSNDHKSYYNDHIPRSNDYRSHYDHHDRYRSSGPQYCKTNVRYEGNVKITQNLLLIFYLRNF